MGEAIAAIGVPQVRRSRASWPDALIVGVCRLPVPAWLFYLLLAGPPLAYSYWIWTAGAIPGSALRVPVVILFGAQLAYPLAGAHWLDAAAARAFARFRPLLPLGADTAALERELRSVPPAGAWIAMAVFAVVFMATVGSADTERQFTQLGLSFASVRIPMTVYFVVLGAIWGPFVYRAFHQLRVIGRLHAMAVGVDPLRPAAAHAFSGFTMRLAILLAAYGYAWFGIDPSVQSQSAVTIAFDVGYIALAIAVFALPLWGMHRRLATEREAMLEAANMRFEAATAELHVRVDEMDLSDADALSKTIASLVAERDVLHHTPTWPWQAATLNTFLTALAAPIVLFFVTRALERLL